VWWSSTRPRPDWTPARIIALFSFQRAFSDLLRLHLSACSACPYSTFGKSVFKPFPEDFFQIFNAHSGRAAVMCTSFLIDIRFLPWQAVPEEKTDDFRTGEAILLEAANRNRPSVAELRRQREEGAIGALVCA
jgi:hypothetical protein